MAIRFGNGFGIGTSNGGGPSLSFFTNIGAIATYLKGYMSDFQNPNFYFYTLDGNGFYINDGQGDMYDEGNATTPWLISNQTYTGSSSYSISNYPHAVNYQTTINPGTEDTSFGYLSLGYNSINYSPLTVIGTRATIASAGTPIGFQCGGNSGADGQGTHVEGNIYSGDTVSGFTVHAYYSETYDAGDPSTCSVFILLGHPDWNSVFGDVFYGADSNTNGNGAFLYTSGGGAQNVLAIKTLLSKDNGVEVTFSEVNTVVDNFILRIKEAKDSLPTPFTVTISEVGSDVVMTASGTINTSGLTQLYINQGPMATGGLVGIYNGLFMIAPNNPYFDIYSGFTSTPSNFGTGGGNVLTNITTGDFIAVIIDGNDHWLELPAGYVSGTQIDSSLTLTSATLNSLGLTPGIYTYTWGSGANSNAMYVVIGS